MAGNPANLEAGYCIFDQISGWAVYWISGYFISKQLHILVFFQKGEVLASIGKTQLHIWPAIRLFGRLKKAGYSVHLQIEYQEYMQNTYHIRISRKEYREQHKENIRNRKLRIINNIQEGKNLKTRKNIRNTRSI